MHGTGNLLPMTDANANALIAQGKTGYSTTFTYDAIGLLQCETHRYLRPARSPPRSVATRPAPSRKFRSFSWSRLHRAGSLDAGTVTGRMDLGSGLTMYGTGTDSARGQGPAAAAVARAGPGDKAGLALLREIPEAFQGAERYVFLEAVRHSAARRRLRSSSSR
jgi:hypothetical protein